MLCPECPKEIERLRRSGFTGNPGVCHGCPSGRSTQALFSKCPSCSADAGVCAKCGHGLSRSQFLDALEINLTLSALVIEVVDYSHVVVLIGPELLRVSAKLCWEDVGNTNDTEVNKRRLIREMKKGERLNVSIKSLTPALLVRTRHSAPRPSPKTR